MTIVEALSLTTRVNVATAPEAFESEVILLASLRAVGNVGDDKRNPVDIVVVLDVSASMKESNKLELCKESLAFLCKEGLKEGDRLGLVTFDSEVKLVFPCEPMNEINKANFLTKLKSLKVGDHTNLSGGLFEGLTALQNIHSSNVSAVLLFSDGEMTSGVTDRQTTTGADDEKHHF